MVLLSAAAANSRYFHPPVPPQLLDPEAAPNVRIRRHVEMRQFNEAAAVVKNVASNDEVYQLVHSIDMEWLIAKIPDSLPLLDTICVKLQANETRNFPVDRLFLDQLVGNFIALIAKPILEAQVNFEYKNYRF